MLLICSAVMGQNAVVNEQDDEEQHSASAPPANRQKHITIRQWAAYYLQIRDPSPDGQRLQRLQRLFEVRLFDVHYSGCNILFLELL